MEDGPRASFEALGPSVQRNADDQVILCPSLSAADRKFGKQAAWFPA
jgi:hypothetical protein